MRESVLRLETAQGVVPQENSYALNFELQFFIMITGHFDLMMVSLFVVPVLEAVVRHVA